MFGGDEEGTRRVVYEPSGATFVPRCHCGRFVKADDSVPVNEINGLKKGTNGVCSVHGRVEMRFEGFI